MRAYYNPNYRDAWTLLPDRWQRHLNDGTHWQALGASDRGMFYHCEIPMRRDYRFLGKRVHNPPPHIKALESEL